MQDKVLVPLAPGFEEIEAVTILDVLRRAEIPVVAAGLTPGPVRGAHDITFEPDASLDDVDAGELAMIVLPGGLPGATNLLEDERIGKIVRELHASGRHVAAICAAPMVLGAAGVLDGVPATCYPGFEDRLGDAIRSEERVVRADRVLTSRGPGTALEFALAIVETLRGSGPASALREGMLVRA
ncbi:MAG TPA: DJ-1/PfpI family protein [Planctomycetes bacterium]|nr:DJ-1/PfpI family protein [Planctomycetota bacterium]